MACGMSGSDDYTNLFRWSEAVEVAGSTPDNTEPAAVAARIAAEIEATTTAIDWRATAGHITGSSKSVDSG
jgi:hypothetical protein